MIKEHFTFTYLNFCALIFFVGAITGKAPAIDKTSAQTASLNRNFDNSKIKGAIGIEFKPISKTILEICGALK